MARPCLKFNIMTTPVKSLLVLTPFRDIPLSRMPIYCTSFLLVNLTHPNNTYLGRYLVVWSTSGSFELEQHPLSIIVESLKGSPRLLCFSIPLFTRPRAAGSLQHLIKNKTGALWIKYRTWKQSRDKCLVNRVCQSLRQLSCILV